LTLRANGNLTMNGSLSDGFSTALANGVLQANADTFSYHLIAGADYSAANLNETVAGTGNFTLANGKLIRTGEGDITIAAGGNMTLGNMSSVIYTVGKAVDTLTGFVAGTSGTNVANTASYVNNGGDITVTVLGNITGAATTQTVNQWLLRQGGDGVDTSWWIRPDLFQQGIGALGGGNVQIQAGGNITNVSASSAMR
jgi:TRAP-type mannitol/chloroaromatic compound transport system substrate-binding protein